ncbi:MAG TPA: WG repeat-containing protein [Methylomirabilota bacterium]
MALALLVSFFATTKGAAQAVNPALYPVKVGGKYGYIDARGKLVVPAQFDAAGDFDAGLAPVKIGPRWGFIDAAGKTVIAPQFDLAWGFRDNVALVQLGTSLTGRRTRLIGRDGRFITTGEYASARVLGGGLIGIEVRGKWGIVDSDGHTTVSPRFDEIAEVGEGVLPFRRGAVWGFVDPAGKIIVPAQFDTARPFADTLAAVEINRARDTSAVCRADRVTCVGHWGFIGHDGRFVIPATYDSAASFAEGLARIEVDRRDSPHPECRPHVSLVQCGGKIGFLDRTGRIVIAPAYDRAWDFANGRARVERAGKVGFIDRQGATVVDLRFDAAGDFRDGLAPARAGAQWGYIDASGAFAIPPRFDDAGPFVSGLARVTSGGRVGYIDHAGDFVWAAGD